MLSSGICKPPLVCTLQVFQDAGLEWPILGSVLMGALNLGVTLLAASLADTAGRRRLLLISFGGMAAALAAVAALGAVPGLVAGWRGGLQAGALLAYVAAFALGAGPVTWLYLSEILPPQIKGGHTNLPNVDAVCKCHDDKSPTSVDNKHVAVFVRIGLRSHSTIRCTPIPVVFHIISHC